MNGQILIQVFCHKGKIKVRCEKSTGQLKLFQKKIIDDLRNNINEYKCENQLISEDDRIAKSALKKAETDVANVDVERWLQSLKDRELSGNTIGVYITTITHYFKMFEELSKENLTKFKIHMMEKYAVKTINCKIAAINEFLKFINKSDLKIKNVKVQEKNHLENTLSKSEYKKLIEYVKNKNQKHYFIIRTLAETGLRVSEFTQIRKTHIYSGFSEVVGKGGKVRRVHFPEKLKLDLIKYIEKEQLGEVVFSGVSAGKPITTRGVSQFIASYSLETNIEREKLFPHNFRHFFAKEFISNGGNLDLLANLIGHSNINTTRIYTMQSSDEQLKAINKIINW